MSLVELQFLYEIGRITKPSSIIVEYLRESIGLEVCEIDFSKVAIESHDVQWTRDPFDRLIAANVRAKKARLISKDECILSNFKNSIW